MGDIKIPGTFNILRSIKDICHLYNGSCVGCPYVSDRDDDYHCRVQRITGTYPDSWKEVKL